MNISPIMARIFCFVHYHYFKCTEQYLGAQSRHSVNICSKNEWMMLVASPYPITLVQWLECGKQEFLSLQTLRAFAMFNVAPGKSVQSSGSERAFASLLLRQTCKGLHRTNFNSNTMWQQKATALVGLWGSSSLLIYQRRMTLLPSWGSKPGDKVNTKGMPREARTYCIDYIGN